MKLLFQVQWNPTLMEWSVYAGRAYVGGDRDREAARRMKDEMRRRFL